MTISSPPIALRSTSLTEPYTAFSILEPLLQGCPDKKMHILFQLVFTGETLIFKASQFAFVPFGLYSSLKFVDKERRHQSFHNWRYEYIASLIIRYTDNEIDGYKYGYIVSYLYIHVY